MVIGFFVAAGAVSAALLTARPVPASGGPAEAAGRVAEVPVPASHADQR